MPCDTIRLQSVQLERCNAQIMLDALSALALAPILQNKIIRFGRNEWINTETGQSQLSQWRAPKEIKQAYSKALVQRTAKRMGWPVKVNAKDPMQMEMIKR